jgi:hypothetical protein
VCYCVCVCGGSSAASAVAVVVDVWLYLCGNYINWDMQESVGIDSGVVV